MKKIHLGHGGHIIPEWENYEKHQIDIEQPLPFGNETVDRLFLEHVLEHADPVKGFLFLKEAFRVLKHNGILRVIVPDVVRIQKYSNEAYKNFVKQRCNQSMSPVESIICNWDHKSIYSSDLLETLLKEVGFNKCIFCNPCDSDDVHLKNID